MPRPRNQSNSQRRREVQRYALSDESGLRPIHPPEVNAIFGWDEVFGEGTDRSGFRLVLNTDLGQFNFGFLNPIPDALGGNAVFHGLDGFLTWIDKNDTAALNRAIRGMRNARRGRTASPAITTAPIPPARPRRSRTRRTVLTRAPSGPGNF